MTCLKHIFTVERQVKIKINQKDNPLKRAKLQERLRERFSIPERVIINQFIIQEATE